jgi:hypothetical protein
MSGLDVNSLLAMSQLMPGAGGGSGMMQQGGAGSQNSPDVAALLAMLSNIANGC